jgi:NADPH:quinone reductase
VRAAVIEEKGGRPVVVRDYEAPNAQGGAVVIDVIAAGIGPTDLSRAAGSSRPYPGPHIVNGEGVGLLNGRRVYFGHSVAPYGALAERTLVPEGWVWPISGGVGDEFGSVLGLAGTAALVSLESAHVRPGDRVLVVGATGVVGQVALQLARAMGAGVVAGAGRNVATLERLQQQGLADVIAQIGGEDDLTALQAICGDGWDVVVDIVFGPPGEAALKTTAKGARVTVVGSSAGRTSMLAAADLNGRSITSVGTNDLSHQERRRAYEYLSALVVRGVLEVPTTAYGLDDVAEAWSALEGSPNAKIIVRPS